MKIQILGTGCKKCKKLYENAQLAADTLGLTYEIEKVEDIEKITAMGIMMTPALVVDGKVKASGRLLSSKEIAGFLK